MSENKVNLCDFNFNNPTKEEEETDHQTAIDHTLPRVAADTFLVNTPDEALSHLNFLFQAAPPPPEEVEEDDDDVTAGTTDFVFHINEEHHGAETNGTKRVANDVRQIRRDRMKKRIQTLQQLIPNCNTRDKESVLDCAIKHIKLLQDQIKVMAMGSSSCFQAPYMFHGNYQGFQAPPGYDQFMHQMEGGIGMPIYGMTRMPFAYLSPYQSNVASSQTPMFGGALPQNQMAFDPFGSLPSADTMRVHSTTSSSSSQSEPIAYDFGQLPPMSQGLAQSDTNARVLPTQIITPSSTRESDAEIQ